MNTFGPYTTEQQLAIVKDLLKKRPSGGADRHGMEMETVHDYCPRYHKYRDLFKCNKDYWGYSAHQIHRLGLHTKGAVDFFILEHWYSGQSEYSLSNGEKSGFSRKANRLWERIDQIHNDIRHGKVPGVYRVEAGDYYTRATLGYVLATDGNHATQLGTTLFGGFAGGREDFRATYVDFPEGDRLQKRASRLQTKLEEQLDKAKKKHAEQIAKMESEIQAAQMALLIAMDLAADIGAA